MPYTPGTFGAALDPLFPVAEAEFPQYAALLKTLQIELDVVTGGNPIVFPVFPLDGSAPCFARGTRIRTVSGDVAVEDLAEGDRVVLATGGEAPIVWIGRRRVHVGRHAYPATVAPIRIAPGALGRAQPERPLRVSPDHALFVDGVLVPAGLLVNGSTIVQETVVAVEYFHIELPTHAVLLAEGLSAESYLDTGNRGMFANTPLARTPTAPPATPCAEMVLDGERLARIRDALTPALSIAS